MKSHKDYVDVTEPPFNAVGDGVTDDTKAIQDAVNALPGGGTVFFPREEERAAITTPLGPSEANESDDEVHIRRAIAKLNECGG